NIRMSLEALGFKGTAPDPTDHQLTFFNELDLYLGKAGIGSARFRKNAIWYIDKLSPDLVICAGGAGALAEDIDIGALFAKTSEKRWTDTLNDIFPDIAPPNAILSTEVEVNSADLATELRKTTGYQVVAQEGDGL